MSEEQEIMVAESKFTQANRAQLVEARKRVFTIVAADGETVATLRGSEENGEPIRLKYSSKSHAKSLPDWPGKPLIVNHGHGQFKQVGEILNADIGEAGLILSFRVDDDRMLEIIERDGYEGFSIGTGVNPHDPLHVIDDRIYSYQPAELSVIMMPFTPACPKGVCDIISMITCSCSSEDESVTENEDNEVISMGDEVTGTKHDCSCKKGESNATPVDMSKFVPKAEHEVALSAKTERIQELEAEHNDVKAELEAKVEELSKELAAFREEKREVLVSSLPETNKIDYNELSLPELERLVSFYQEAKTEDAGAKETAAESSADEKPAKPWLRTTYEPGKY